MGRWLWPQRPWWAAHGLGAGPVRRAEEAPSLCGQDPAQPPNAQPTMRCVKLGPGQSQGGDAFSWGALQGPRSRSCKLGRCTESQGGNSRLPDPEGRHWQVGLREDSSRRGLPVTLPGSDSLCKSKSLLGEGTSDAEPGPLPLETGGRWEEGVLKGQAASRVRAALLGGTAWGAVRPRPALLSWVQPKVREGSGPGPAHGRLQAPVPQHSRDIPMDKGGTGWSNTAEELGEKGEAGDHSLQP